MAEAIFLRDGDGFVPTELSAGPWDPGSQHGGAPAALLARALEALPSEQPMRVARLTVELLRPAPMARLTVTAEAARPGRRVQLLTARLSAGETEIARATAVRIRAADVPFPAVADESPPPPPPEAGVDPRKGRWFGFGDAMDMVLVAGSIERPGPATVWYRLRVPMVEGEEPSPLQRVVAAADFGNGMSAVADFRDALFINPDLSVYLHRPLEGEWVALAARTFAGQDGIGLAESALHDRGGRIGRSLQSLLLDRR